MAVTKEEVVEFIANMTVLELSEFIKELEEKFGVSAAAPAAAPAPAAASAAPTAVAAGEVVAAPMPGNILKVNCSQGQAVKAGDILVVLEAMKMENEILAPRDGTVAQVVTTKGAVVDTGAPLVVLA